MGGPFPIARLAWLLACFLAGLATGFVGDALTGNQAWYLAIPALLAIGWLFLADPTQCEPPARKPPGAARRGRM